MFFRSLKKEVAVPHNTPSFWYPSDKEDLPLQAKLLQPLSWLYTCGFKIHQGVSSAQEVEIPVVCIGNCVVEAGVQQLAVAELPLVLDVDSVRARGRGTARTSGWPPRPLA